MAPSRHDWKIVDWDVKPQHNQPTAVFFLVSNFFRIFTVKEPHHEKTCLCHMRTTKAQISLGSIIPVLGIAEISRPLS